MKGKLLISVVVATLTLGQPATGAATPIGAQVLDEAATASQPAVRLNPPDAAPAPQPCDTECIIRDVWSGEAQYIIEKAVRTAKRESGPNLKVTAENYCCYGIFQIYFKMHRELLRSFGVYQPSDLFDPRVNATVALTLFHIDGWRPWSGGA